MFKVGDVVFIMAEITDVHPGSERPYFVSPCFYNINWVSEDKIIQMDKTYSDGLNDAWELAKKIYDMKCDAIEEIFGVKGGFYEVIRNFTFEDCRDKIEAYEKEKEIKVGDVVESRDAKRKFLVVTEEDDDSVYEFGVIDLKTLTLDRICNYPKGFTKTGKHIDIESLLRQIGE